MDLSNQFNTPLSPEEQKKYLQWIALSKMQEPSYDYDMPGFFKSGQSQAANGHFTDEFKKPNHPTFSNESQYSTPETQGGNWDKNVLGQNTFTPSEQNVKNMGIDGLSEYFKNREPDSVLKLQSDKNTRFNDIKRFINR